MKKYRVSGKKIEDLLEKVSKKLKVEKERVAYEIISKEKVLGFTKSITLNVWVKPTEAQLKKHEALVEAKKQKHISDLEEKVHLDVNEKGVFLKIDKDLEFEKNELIAIVSKRGIEEFDMEKMEKAYEFRGKMFRIGLFLPEIYIESEIDISADLTKSKCFLKVTKPIGLKAPSFEEIMGKLQEENIRFGIKEFEVKKLLQNATYDKDFLIAEGIEGIDGKDGYIEYLIKSVNAKANLKPASNEDGTVDFKNLDLLDNVQKGDELAIKVLGTRGTPGTNVFGEEIPIKDGADVDLPIGENTAPSEDGMVLLAEIDGIVSIKDNKVSVKDAFITEEVGIHTGNIDFAGSVIVDGDLMPDYEIKAGGSVEIKGNLEKAIVEAEGDVFVKGSCFGKLKGEIKAGNDIIINFSEAMILRARGNIIANEGIMNSKIYSDKKLLVIDKKGTIIGGEIRAAEGIEAINIGSHQAVKTDIEVGNNPEIIEKIKNSKKEFKELDSELDQAEKNVVLLQKMKMTLKDNMPLDKKEMLAKLVKAKFSLRKKIEIVQKELRKNQKLSEGVNSASVIVRGKCYPGVKIKIKDAVYLVREEIQSMKFFYDERMIKMVALR